MNEQEFKKRTKAVGLQAIRLLDDVPKNRASDVLAKQLLRAATSIGANYRAACRGKSRADAIAKLSVVEEEADETLYWLEMLVEANFVPRVVASTLMTETEEILAMTVASIKTLRGESKIQNPKSKIC